MSDFWNTAHIDLSKQLPHVDVRAPALGVFMVFHWNGIPLGHARIEAARLPLSAAGLADVALREIAPAVNSYVSEQGIALPAEDAPSLPEARLEYMLMRLDDLTCHVPGGDQLPHASISVIVPTCNRPAQLAACLQSLQTLHLQPLEILVVDNMPQSAATRDVVSQFPGIRYVAEPRRGSSAARNTGAAHSNGHLIAFVDDDEIVDPYWLTWLSLCFSDPAVAVATGLVLPAELQTEAQVLFEQRFSFIRGYAPRTFGDRFFARRRHHPVPVWSIGGSGNMAVQRRVFEQLGGFDERLGAGQAGCSEDTEFFYRVLTQGWHCRYEPRAVIYHHHRRDLGYLKQQLFLYMRGHVTALLVQYDRHGDLGNLAQLLWVLPKEYAKYCVRRLLGDPRLRGGTLGAEIAGCLSGFSFYWRHRTCPPSSLAPFSRVEL